MNALVYWLFQHKAEQLNYNHWFCRLNGYYGLYNLFEVAISNMLGLHQLRHGTSLPNILNIVWYGRGLNPAIASLSKGEAYFNTIDSETNKNFANFQNQFVYLWRDVPLRKGILHNNGMSKRIFPFEYSFKSGTGSCDFNKLPPVLRSVVRLIGGIANMIFVPTLKFHHTPDEVNAFEKDPQLIHDAVRTKEIVSSSRVGLLGALRVGLNNRLWERIKKDPKRSVSGVIQLIAAVILTRQFFKGTPLTDDSLLRLRYVFLFQGT